MRSVVLAIVLWMAVAPVYADDGGPVVTNFPETAGHFSVYLFNLKKNGIALNVSADEFCQSMDYGNAVHSDRSDEIKGNAVVPGKLNWVICRFKAK